MTETIGYLILTETKTFTRAYETASNFARIEVPAGEYPVTVCQHINGRVRAELPGTLTQTHFVNRLGASMSVHDEAPMTPDVFHWGAYNFEWKDMIARGDARSAE